MPTPTPRGGARPRGTSPCRQLIPRTCLLSWPLASSPHSCSLLASFPRYRCRPTCFVRDVAKPSAVFNLLVFQFLSFYTGLLIRPNYVHSMTRHPHFPP